MVAIAIILWAVIIIVIAECANPGLLGVIFGSIAAYGALYLAVIKIVDKIKARRRNRRT